MTIRPTLAIVIAALVIEAPAPREQSARSFDVVEVARGVYSFVQTDPLMSPIDGNTTVIINANDVVVVDSRITPGAAREVIREIRKLTPNPVRFVVNTHWHSDHHYGNDAFRTAYPGVEFIAHPRMRADMIAQDTDSILRFNVDSAYPRLIADRRRLLSTGRMADGTVMPPEMRAFYEKQIVGMEYTSREFRGVRLVPPTLLVSDRLTLHRGARTIDIRFMGRANTRGDLVVHLPEDRVLITGDILVAPIPFAFGSYIGEWIETLAELRRLEVDVIVPGHGAIQRDWSYLDRVSALLDSTLRQTKRSVAAGKDLAGVRQDVTLDSLRVVFSGGDVLRDRSFRNFFATPGVERAFREAKGELDPP
jgi:cyclase